MTNEQREKYSRLQDRLKELKDLNDRIGKLSFFINADIENGNVIEELMERQLFQMIDYRTTLEERINKGIY